MISQPQRRSRRSRYVVAALLLAAGGGGAWAVLSGASPAAPPARGGSTTTGRASGGADFATAAVIDFDVTTLGTGALEAKKQVELRNALDFETALVELVPEGTRVKKGDVLAKLNTDQIDQQIDQQEIELERAKNEQAAAESELEIQKTESTAELRKAQVALELAELEYQQWLQGDVESKRQELRVKLDEAKSESERLGLKVAQNKNLREQGFISQDELQKQELEWRKQQAALETAQLSQRVYEEFQVPKERKTKQEVIDSAAAELEKTRQRSASQLASKTSRVTNCRQEVALRTQRLDKLKSERETAVLTAPQDGLVVYGTTVERRWWNNEGPLQIGRKVYPNQLIIALPDTSAMNAVVSVHESIAGKVKAGQPASITIDAIGGKTVTGTVEKIGLLAQGGNWQDPNLREFSVTINLGPEATGLDIRPSMRCEAVITLDHASQALSVPAQAVFAEGPVRFVYVQRAGSGGLLQRVAVMCGKKSDRFAEITHGLRTGEEVLVRVPKAGEASPDPFSDEALAAVGLQRNARGEVVVKGDPAPAATTPATTPEAAKESVKEPAASAAAAPNP